MSDDQSRDDQASDDSAPGTGITEEMIEATLGDLDDPSAEAVLGPTTLTALRLADVMAGFFPKVDADFFAELRCEFSEGQILELGAALSVASGWQRMIEAFGIRPDATRELRDLTG